MSMKCDFQDGWKVDYSGDLRIKHGDDVNVYITSGNIPSEFKNDLDSCDSCDSLKKLAQDITNKVGPHACLHE
ncbi:hypothetical protein LPW11_20935 [Geomonas sp. RF6]|uniref:hypothetical protein n=1 Tax=Geomonas sp. RF6 TaxID=2897342 RepID=UPI001E2E74FF|nr:hypothetical protein [Geomonas sp. RF6]UFS70327.1 hypothetical protein LPW11_20935 [Geomonas sp. RF6]